MSDLELRNAALFAVQRLWRRFGDGVPYRAIAEGFEHRGERLPFLSPFEGVFRPRQLEVGALSVRSTLGSRYDDERISDDQVWYDYSPHDSRNRWLRESRDMGLDLLYFLQVKQKPGVEYLIFAPIHVMDNDPLRRRLLLDLSPSTAYEGTPEILELHKVMERRYGASEVRTRLFQAHFRKQVLAAYRSRCAICALRERPMLDGAHLVPDREELGEPRVPNGLALCALHHRTLDRDLVGITLELKVHVFEDRLEHAAEAPTVAAITRFHGQRLLLPSDAELQPDRQLVALRWEEAVAG